MKTTTTLIILTIGLYTTLNFGCKKAELSNVTQQESDLSWMNYPLDTSPAWPNGLNPEPGFPNGLPAENEKFNPQSRILSYPNSSYTSVPDPNILLPTPSSSTNISGVIYYGGPFQSSINVINGQSITFRLIRTDGYSFSPGSILQVHANNAGGPIVASIVLQNYTTSYNLSITENTTWNLAGTGNSNPNNYKNYVTTWYNPDSRLNFYTQPIKIIAVPTGWGAFLTSLNTVGVYSNGYGGFSSTNYLTDTYGQKYQCVHYIKKYYSIAKSRNIGNGNADVYWYNYTSHNLTQRINNGSGIPQIGDIICFSSTTGAYHVGIVAGVPISGYLRVFQENVGQTLGSFISGNYCSGYKDFAFTSSSSGFSVSASTLGSTWSTLGWVR